MMMVSTLIPCVNEQHRFVRNNTSNTWNCVHCNFTIDSLGVDLNQSGEAALEKVKMLLGEMVKQVENLNKQDPPLNVEEIVGLKYYYQFYASVNNYINAADPQGKISEWFIRHLRLS